MRISIQKPFQLVVKLGHVLVAMTLVVAPAVAQEEPSEDLVIYREAVRDYALALYDYSVWAGDNPQEIQPECSRQEFIGTIFGKSFRPEDNENSETRIIDLLIPTFRPGYSGQPGSHGGHCYLSRTRALEEGERLFMASELFEEVMLP